MRRILPAAHRSRKDGATLRKQGFNLSHIARRIARESLKVRDRELIWIVCGKHNISFAEDIAAEVALSGGYPIIEISSSHVNREVYLKAGQEYLQRPRKSIARMKRMVDGSVWINPEEDPTFMKDVPMERLSMVKRSYEEEYKMLEEMQLKQVLVEYPTPQQAKTLGVDYQEFFEMVWGGIEVDPDYLYEVCKKIEKPFNDTDKIRLYSPKGTDLTLSYRGRMVLQDTGTITDESYLVGDPLINLPAGEIFLAPLEDSAQGQAVFDDVWISGRHVKDLCLKFDKGHVVDFSATQGEEHFRDYFDNLTLPGRIIAEFGIGLNPFIQKVIGLLSTDEKAVGTVHIAIGSNRHFGGRNFAENHDDFVIQSPTVFIGDCPLIVEGKFAPKLDICGDPVQCARHR